MLYIGYVRVSTREQGDSGVGLEAQRLAIRAWAGQQGVELLLVEDVATGKNVNRPGLQRARSLLQSGQAAGLVVMKLDRLARSVIDFATILHEAQTEGWILAVLDCPIDVTTPQGEAMASMVAVFAQLERRLIGQRTREGLAVVKAKGIRIGRPPAVPTPLRVRIREHRAEGLTLRAIADQLNAEDVPTAHAGKRWHASTVGYVLGS
jgi:DNA invertase Pin-like site-specific DNA recombinase